MGSGASVLTYGVASVVDRLGLLRPLSMAAGYVTKVLSGVVVPSSQ